MKIKLAVAFAVLFLASAAHADGVATPTYSISGLMVFTGNNTCSPAPCSEAVAYSFDLQYQLEFGFYSAFITNFSDIVTGDLGSFTTSYPNGFYPSIPIPTSAGECSGDVNLIPINDAGGDEFELSLCQNEVPAPVVPSLSDPLLYACATATCNTEFPENENLSGADSEGGVFEDVTIKEIPEPTTLAQLAVGLLSIAFFLVNFRKSSA
jgi:hypothetical protein